MMIDFNLSDLLQQLKENPNDDSLMSDIALYYLRNPEDSKDLEYFEMAYKTNPSIENTHNLAFILFFEYGEVTRGLQLQEQVLDMYPQSFYPYASYAQMMISNELDYKDGKSSCLFNTLDYQKYIEVCEYALKLINKMEGNFYQWERKYSYYFYHNIGYAYAKINDYETALYNFNKCEQLIKALLKSELGEFNKVDLGESLYEVKLNKAYVSLLLGKHYKVKSLLLEIEEECEGHYCGLNLGSLYAKLGEYNKTNCIVKDDYIDPSWDWVWYAIFKGDKNRWIGLIESCLHEEANNIQFFQKNIKAFKLENKYEEIVEELKSIEDSQLEINRLKSILSNGNQPKPLDVSDEDIKLFLNYRHLGCLLFGCLEHSNLLNDSVKHLLA